MKKMLSFITLVWLTSYAGAQCWTSFDAGAEHSTAIQFNTLWTWGYNCCGQLGNGTLVNTNAPAQVDSSNNWQSVSGNTFHSIGIKTDGTLWAWGRNHEGQLGDGTFNDQLTPIQIGTENDWEIVSAGYENSYAMKSDHTIWGWGANGYSELGTASGPSVTLPTQIGSGSNWKIIKAGYRNAMGIKQDSTLWLWGSNSWGQIGNGSQIDQTIPFQIGTSKWIDASIYWNHTLAIRADGTLWGWGNNFNQKLGDSAHTDYNYTTPVQIGSDSDWLKIHGGYHHSVGIKNDGSLWTWGANDYGQLGDTTSGQRIEPLQVGTKNNWVRISSGQNFVMALDDTDSLFTWGDNAKGSLGDNTNTNRPDILPINCTYFAGLNELQNGTERITIYPNPSDDFVTLDFGEEKMLSLVLYDLSGKIVRQQDIKNVPTYTLANLQSGIYILALTKADGNVISLKLIRTP